MKQFYTDIDLRGHNLQNASIAGGQENDIIKVGANGGLVASPLSLVTDETVLSGTIVLLKSGYNYFVSSSISALSVTAVENGDLESNVFFTVTGNNFSVSMPNNVKCIGTKPEFESGEQYVMSYYRNTVVFGKLASLVSEE